MAADNTAIVRRYFEEVVNTGNLAVADELISTRYVSHYLTGYNFAGQRRQWHPQSGCTIGREDRVLLFLQSVLV
jgi:hypothetical protein